MYAASGHELRKDWFGDDGTKGRHRRLAETFRPAGVDTGIIAGVSNTDFLQAISLFHTRDRRRTAENAGKQGKELPAVSGNRQALLNLPLEEYKRYELQVERAFVQAAKFLHMLHIYRIFDLPYQSQIVPLAAILADIGDAWEHEANRAMLIRWYWNGGGRVSEFARDDFLYDGLVLFFCFVVKTGASARFAKGLTPTDFPNGTSSVGCWEMSADWLTGGQPQLCVHVPDPLFVSRTRWQYRRRNACRLYAERERAPATTVLT